MQKLSYRVAQTFLKRTAFLEKTALRQAQLKKMMGIRGTFGIISAYSTGSKSQNKQRHGMLLSDLQALGYRWTDLKGSWDGKSEKSVLVPGIKPQELFSLGRKYGQDAVICKTTEGILGMYNLKTKTVEVAVNPEDMGPAFEVAVNDSLYSKTRGLSFSVNFLWGHSIPWNGGSPLRKGDVVEALKQGLLEAA